MPLRGTTADENGTQILSFFRKKETINADCFFLVISQALIKR